VATTSITSILKKSEKDGFKLLLEDKVNAQVNPDTEKFKCKLKDNINKKPEAEAETEAEDHLKQEIDNRVDDQIMNDRIPSLSSYKKTREAEYDRQFEIDMHSNSHKGDEDKELATGNSGELTCKFEFK